MATDEFGERTEQPTERRRQESRRKGNVARSTDLTSAGLMLAAAAAIYLFGISIARALGELMQHQVGGTAWRQTSGPSVVALFRSVAESLAPSVLSLMLMMAASVLLFNIVQVGFLFTTEPLQPKLSRLSPIEGMKRIFSLRGLVKLAVSLGKLLALTAIAAWFLTATLPELLAAIDVEWMPPAPLDSGEPLRDVGLAASLLVGLRNWLATFGLWLALALVVLAVMDYGFQRWKYERDLRMTKQEVRDEMKNMEGDPQTRQRRRDAHRKLAQARELARVPEADVVITNPTQIAVALKYDPDQMAAPTVVAKGMGEIAARIRRIAVEHGIPVIERKPLAQALYRDVKVGQAIPVEMYEVFVEIMAYVYRLTGRTPPNLQ